MCSSEQLFPKHLSIEKSMQSENFLTNLHIFWKEKLFNGEKRFFMSFCSKLILWRFVCRYLSVVRKNVILFPNPPYYILLSCIQRRILAWVLYNFILFFCFRKKVNIMSWIKFNCLKMFDKPQKWLCNIGKKKFDKPQILDLPSEIVRNSQKCWKEFL